MYEMGKTQQNAYYRNEVKWNFERQRIEIE